ncbi:hypothetical protein DPEC_G00034270 [Dallia pectoralis]|uniref:Uncharacterized protein n=1 Tax=Dallia pectoralis TaxID=75939 RepID=A0ACC2HEG3_DALPE|nr:hypothetical protein DPEC_G00034270 [Dallia pectoralis]
MSSLSRPHTRSNGSTALNGRETIGESHACGEATSNPAQSDKPQSCDRNRQSPRGGITTPTSSLLGFQSTSSSGYCSFDCDSVPSSPLLRHNKSTQTPSPSSRVITHAMSRLSRPHDTWRAYEAWPRPRRPNRPRPPPRAGVMCSETLIGQELQRIGDEFNNLFMHGRLGARNGQVGQANRLQMYQEPAFLLWMGLLIGRLLQIFWRRR